jgi:cytidylate kinase
MAPDQKHHNFVLALDGPAASGKGTIGRRIAVHFDLAFLDTGLLYRAVGHKILAENKDPNNASEATRAAELLAKKLKQESEINAILNNPALRTEGISQAASSASVHAPVRAALLQFQREFAAHPSLGKKGVVMDGRDMGTIVCPDADLKVFITASVEIRAERRVKELQNNGISATYAAVLADMQARDQRDMNRLVAPTRPADDAIVIDTSTMDVEEVFEQVSALVSEKISQS